MLNFDKTRSFVYGILTDLDKFCLFKVKREAVQFNLVRGVETTRYVDWCKPDDAYCGLEIMAYLTMLAPEQLGMQPQAQVLHKFHITRYLGGGNKALVYRVENQAPSPPSALKVARVPGDTKEPIFENERAVLDALHKVPVSAKSEHSATSKLTPWDHIPSLAKQSHPNFVLMTLPIAIKLTCVNIRAIFVYQLFQVLRWLHVDCKRFHGDLSYNNLMLAASDWRLGKPVDGASMYSLLLIDWEFSVKRSEAEDGVLQGTILTMSQIQLSAYLEHVKRGIEGSLTSQTASFAYDVDDELEAAVKSILLILSPSLKRRLKQKAMTSVDHISGERVQTGRPDTPPELIEQHRMIAHVRGVWQSVLPTHVFDLCSLHKYTELADWLCNELLHFDSQELGERTHSRLK
jgi:serine/threonine protein kinase